ncbi:MAG TPA: hypothetical protein VGM77_12170 [Gemmatimonadales bacterium]|jgi:hypothetical protein
MKSRFALLAMLVVAAAPLAAQGGGGGGGGGGRGGRGGRGMSIESMTTMYTLTADQVTKTQALLDDYNKNLAPLNAYMQEAGRGNASPDSTKKMQGMRADFNTKFKALLDADQSKKFDSVQAAQAARMQGRGGGK